MTGKIDTGKKSCFFKVFKVPGKIFITTVSKKNVKKKVTTTMVDFNSKVLHYKLIDMGT